MSSKLLPFPMEKLKHRVSVTGTGHTVNRWWSRDQNGDSQTWALAISGHSPGAVGQRPGPGIHEEVKLLLASATARTQTRAECGADSVSPRRCSLAGARLGGDRVGGERTPGRRWRVWLGTMEKASLRAS